MRSLLGLVAIAAFLGSAQAARAQDGAWAALAQRISAADPVADLSVTVGAEPPAFVFPLASRPALPVLGSTWYARSKDAPPLIVRIYYAPTSHTGSASESLFAQLAAAGYAKLPDTDRLRSPFDTAPFVQHMCPRDLRRPSIDVSIRRVGGLPAMDLEIRLHAESSVCRDAVSAPLIKAHEPALTGIPGLTFTGRMTPLGIEQRPMPFQTGTARTSLAPADAVAKMAERFVAKGWTAQPASIAGETTTQQFTALTAVRRLDALLVFDRRAEGVYDVLIAITDAPLDAAPR
jgi:hypothetical protein